ncbi:MAG: hypothetical protein QOK16_2772 [Solirubrobacteraceae bacterium]|jgi:hypothetical protein|nr:hypothetical protein [Solirubrobacteraceae bacterium]
MGHDVTHLVRALADCSADHREAIAESRQRWDAERSNRSPSAGAAGVAFGR